MNLKRNNRSLASATDVRSSSKIFIVLLAFVGVMLGVSVAIKPLISQLFRPNVAQEARRYLQEHSITPLSQELEQLLSEQAGPTIPTQEHPLLQKNAPDFVLSDDQGSPTSLSEQLRHGSTVIVFYYGYHCNHCVGQLFAIHDDIAKFKELGARVLAISADPTDETQARFKEYGRFDFPVLSDPDQRIATKYGMFKPATPASDEKLVHGTFVVSPSGEVTWANFGDEPFTDNRTLLCELAKASGITRKSANGTPPQE